MVETLVGRPLDCLVQILYCVDEEMAAQGRYVIEQGDRLHYLLYGPQSTASVWVSDRVHYSSHTIITY